MTWVLLAGLAVALWWLWDIRRTLGYRTFPVLRRRAKAATAAGIPTASLLRASFAGAVPPNRYVVVRWPDGLHFYRGCVGALARDMFVNTNPAPGEEIELWELGAQRGHKVG